MRVACFIGAPPPERCEPRRETVMPLEKSGFYEQAAGWCAQLHEYERGDCGEWRRQHPA